MIHFPLRFYASIGKSYRINFIALSYSGFTPSGSDITATSNGNDPTALASILNTTLQNNGGDTETHALLDGSPAVDAAPSGQADDQRSIARPQGSDFDIGAFEQEQCLGPASGQVSCWSGRLDADDVWDSNPGTLQNGATFASGLVGQAFSFDGTNDFVLVPDANNLDLTTDFTINAWLYQNAQQSGLHAVVGKGRSSSGTGFALSISNGQTGIGLNNGSTNCVATDSQTLPLGQWNHVAVTFGSSTVKVYVNGQLRATQSCSFSSIGASTEPLNIGRETSGLGRYYAGLADEVQIHNRALSLAEIQALYAGMGTGVPVANNDTYGTNQNTALNESAPGVLGNDTDAASDPLTAVLVSGPAHGSLTLNADGSFTYTPNTGYTGSDSFTYKANDGTYDSNVATVSITVT